MAPTAAEEAAFMAQLMHGLDDSFFSAVPSPDKPKAKHQHHPKQRDAVQPTKRIRTPTGASTAATSFSSTKPMLESKTGSSDPKPGSALDIDIDMASFLEGSESWDLEDFSISPIKPAAKKPASIPTYVPEPCTRCVVQSVVEERVDSQCRKTIAARVESTQEPVNVYLYNDWYYSEIRVDDVFNVIGTFSSPAQSSSNAKRCISITSQDHLLILHPDILLTATALSNATQCRRKPLLSSLVRSTSDITPALVWGSMLHEVMQKCLLEKRWDDVFLDMCIGEAVGAGLGELVKIGLGEDVARREVKDRARGLRLFSEKYLSENPKADAKLVNTRSKASDDPALLAISQVLDIEEDIWSPTYGLKGKIDATVQGTISEPQPSHSGPNSSTNGRKITHVPLPLELKTGRAVTGMEHRAQTMLYTLLIGERYGADVQDGLLFYTQSEKGEVVRVPRGRHEVRGLLSARNELAAYTMRRIRKSKKSKARRSDDEMDVDRDGADVAVEQEEGEREEEPFLPPPIDDDRACTRCYVQDVCMLFRKAHPDHRSSLVKSKASKKTKFDPPVPSFLSGIFEEKTGHLTPSQISFFRDWERLLALEERDLVRFKRELWTLGAAEREKKGRCFAGMVMVAPRKKSSLTQAHAFAAAEVGLEEENAWGKEGKIHRFTYTFARSKHWLASSTPSPAASPSSSSRPSSAPNLLNGHLNVGDPITVSAEPLLALARGYILELTPEEVVLGVDHVLELDALRSRLRREGLPATDEQFFSENGDEVIFRIDKDELFGGMGKVRNNVAQLFYANGDRRRLELVVDLRKPVFSPPEPPFRVSSSLIHGGGSNLDLNPCQADAMEKVLSAEDYALVLGMPGTGKTTVVAALIRELVARGKTVLLTSYTHSAVDTILMKLDGEDGKVKDSHGATFGILRLGNLDKVHTQVRKYTLNERKTATTVEDFERQIMSPRVVATTCLTIEHALFSRRNFDYCIVDEASQITLPTCLGPLRFADKFILVGDHFQLPPLVKNPEARKGGLDVSLFRRLSEAHPEAVVDLRFQYRMNSDIMLLSNRLIYDNRLSCGNSEVASRSLVLRDKKFLSKLHAKGLDDCEGSCWLEKLSAPSCKAVFVDTDDLPARDSRVGDLVQNTTEAELVRQFAETLIRCGVEESQIGIISLYRQQVKLLQHLLQSRQGVEILTADRSQGRDKDCIIISLVRSNEEGTIGDLVRDWRRMNVSFTRARSKLVIFGSRKTLKREPLLAQFFGLMEEKGWILTLPSGADTSHARVFETTSLPSKRVAESENEAPTRRRPAGKENASVKVESTAKDTRPVKKLKVASKKGSVGIPAVLKGRPILSDLVENEV